MKVYQTMCSLETVFTGSSISEELKYFINNELNCTLAFISNFTPRQYRRCEQTMLPCNILLGFKSCYAKFGMHCAIWYRLYNLINVENTHGGTLILVQLQASAYNFTKPFFIKTIHF